MSPGELKISNFYTWLDTFTETINYGTGCRKFPMTWEQWEYFKAALNNFKAETTYIQCYRLREDVSI